MCLNTWNQKSVFKNKNKTNKKLHQHEIQQ